MDFRVSGFQGVGVSRFAFCGWDSGCRVSEGYPHRLAGRMAGFMVQSFRAGVSGFGFQGFRVGVSGVSHRFVLHRAGSRVRGWGFDFRGFGFQVLSFRGLRFQVEGLIGFRGSGIQV